MRPGQRLAVPVPTCNRPTRWQIAERPGRGKLRIRNGKIVYRAAERFRGTVSATLIARPAPGARASATALVAPVQLTAGTAAGAVVRALGDSVTAGFGYYSDGSSMGITSLPGCRPPESGYDDACSSNSTVRSNKVKEVEYAPDYGLSNNISWVAQWAREHGVSNFKNYAVSGSEPADWAPGGQFFATTRKLAAEDPGYVLLTMGANPLLSDMLFGFENMGCALWSDIAGSYTECVEKAFGEVKLRANLKALYRYLVQNTSAEIFVMRYHLSVPGLALAYSSTQIAQMGQLLNREIGSVAAEVSSSRITVVTPPVFRVGLNLEPVYPASYTCEGFITSSQVDGPSVQSTFTQDQLAILHPLEFCSGPEVGPPWVISGDTGIHPSAAGYAQMASRVPAPR